MDLTSVGVSRSWDIDLSSWERKRGLILVALVYFPVQLVLEHEGKTPTTLPVRIKASRRNGEVYTPLWEKELIHPVSYRGEDSALGKIDEPGDFRFELTVLEADVKLPVGLLDISGSGDELMEHAMFAVFF